MAVEEVVGCDSLVRSSTIGSLSGLANDDPATNDPNAWDNRFTAKIAGWIVVVDSYKGNLIK